MLDGVLNHRIHILARHEPDVTCTMWLCPEREGLPSRIVQKGPSEYRLDIVWKQWDGTWFPERLEQMSINPAGEESKRMVVSVEFAEFNIDIDPQVFTLSGLEMPIGQLIDNWLEEPPRAGRWDGERIVDYQ